MWFLVNKVEVKFIKWEINSINDVIFLIQKLKINK